MKATRIGFDLSKDREKFFIWQFLSGLINTVKFLYRKPDNKNGQKTGYAIRITVTIKKI